MSEPTELVTVAFAQGQWEAEIIKTRLEADGIQAILRYEALGPILGVTIGALGRVEVQVAPDDESRAIEVLESKPRPEDPPEPGDDAQDKAAGADAYRPRFPRRDQRSRRNR